MRKYRLTEKGIRCVLGICIVLALILGGCLGSVIANHAQKEQIAAMALEEAAKIADETQQQAKEQRKTDGVRAEYAASSEAQAAPVQMPVTILFDKDTAYLNQPEYEKLEAFAALAGERASGRICVSGHAAFSSDKLAGDSLSYLRARAVKEYLIYRGIKETRIDLEANGYRKPIDEEDVYSPRNMRVELSFRE